MKYTPEQARDALEASSIDFGTQQYLEAIRDHELPQYYSLSFVRYRLHSDNLPGPRLVAEWHPDYPAMKCRASKIMYMSIFLRGSIEDGVVTDEKLITQIHEFCTYPWNCSRGRKGEYWTKPEEIQRINTMLDGVITYLEETYGVQPDWDKARQEIEQERRAIDHLR